MDKHIVLFAAILTSFSSCDYFKDDAKTEEKLAASFTMEAVNSSFTGTSSDLTIYKNEKVQFTNTSTEADSYLWDFGDGETSAAKSPSHVYNKCGSFTARLTISRGGQTI